MIGNLMLEIGSDGASGSYKIANALSDQSEGTEAS
jgi:hypothetical protein